tara:strand:- start:599 stop:1582 length:984 start_codon:yes stop_codon:yes gene_type:complete
MMAKSYYGIDKNTPRNGLKDAPHIYIIIKGRMMTVSTTATTQAKNTLASIDKIKAGCVATIAAHNTPTEIVKCITGFSRLENCAYISKVVAANKFKMAANEQGYFMVTEQGYKDLDDKTGRKVEDLYNTIDTPKKMKWGSFKQYLTAYNRLKRRVDDGGGGGGEDMTDEELIFACGDKSQHQLKIPNCVNLQYNQLVVPDRTRRVTPATNPAVDVSPPAAPVTTPPTITQPIPQIQAPPETQATPDAEADVIEVPRHEPIIDWNAEPPNSSDDEEEDEVTMGDICETLEDDICETDFDKNRLIRFFSLMGMQPGVMARAWERSMRED